MLGRALAVVLLVTACGPGNVPWDYPPAPLGALGIHASPTYVARYVMPAQGLPLLLAHPRLGQPAIRRAGETIDVGWIAPTIAGQATTISLTDGTPLAFSPGTCDSDGVCHQSVALPPSLPLGLHGVCVAIAGASDCSASALAIVAAYHDPATIIHVSDAHVGDGPSQQVFGNVIDQMNALSPAADLAIFTGDAADTGQPAQRAGFITELLRAQMPTFVVTGNHDYDDTGIDGHLVDIGPELDYTASYGGLRLVGLSSGQDLDDDQHETTVSESSGPDASQLDWLAAVLADAAPPTIAFFHHPIYNGLFATIGPDSRDRLKALVTCPEMRAVLTGHTHLSGVFDAVGDDRGLSLDRDVVPAARWPLHYIASRATKDSGGFAVLHVGTSRVDYAWVGLP